jgi:peroxiredoxin (alkyl hydroperoxide reductase subunit C)
MPDNSFEEIELNELNKGKYVILFFYPADFTFVCASEVPGFNKLLKEFEARNCVVVSCSTDTHHAHKGWKLLPKEQGGIGKIDYPMIGDITKEIATAYDVLQEDGLCARGLFLINQEGIVKAEHKNCDPLGRNLDEALRLLDKLVCFLL